MKKIEVKDLSFSYNDGNQIVNGISFSVEEGKHVCLLGHNGSGKSTLSKLLMGLLTPSNGEILIDGVSLTSKKASELRQKMALVFQNPDNQFVGATVEDDVAFGLENRLIKHDEMQPIIDRFLKLVGMSNFAKHEPSNLSGGQKQRVAIASALALSPEILILDEATSMLDPKGKREINSLIKELKTENPKLTIISITHDVNEALYSDEVLIISSGKIVVGGNPEEFFSNKELVIENKLDQPFIYKVKDELKSLDYDVDSCDNIEEMADVICQ